MKWNFDLFCFDFLSICKQAIENDAICVAIVVEPFERSKLCEPTLFPNSRIKDNRGNEQQISYMIISRVNHISVVLFILTTSSSFFSALISVNMRTHIFLRSISMIWFTQKLACSQRSKAKRISWNTTLKTKKEKNNTQTEEEEKKSILKNPYKWLNIYSEK